MRGINKSTILIRMILEAKKAMRKDMTTNKCTKAKKITDIKQKERIQEKNPKITRTKLRKD